MIGPLTYLDAALLAVCLISGLLAMYRGVTREILSIVSWIVAAGAVLYFVLRHKKFAEEMAQQMGTKVEIAQVAVGSVIFLIVLVIVHLITARISDAILDSRVGMIDRVLGFIFGIARGFVLNRSYAVDGVLKHPRAITGAPAELLAALAKLEPFADIDALLLGVERHHVRQDAPLHPACGRVLGRLRHINDRDTVLGFEPFQFDVIKEITRGPINLVEQHAVEFGGILPSVGQEFAKRFTRLVFTGSFGKSKQLDDFTARSLSVRREC